MLVSNNTKYVFSFTNAQNSSTWTDISQSGHKIIQTLLPLATCGYLYIDIIHMTIFRAFPLHSSIPQTIKNWSRSWGGPWNKACILSRSREEKLGEGLGSKLRHRPEMVDSVSTNRVHVTYWPSPLFPVCDVVLIPGLLPIFLHGCDIKSGRGLGTRLPLWSQVLLGYEL